MPIITGRVLEGTDIYTDGWKAYDGLVLKGYEHHRIHDHQNQFARGKNHVNGIESFWSTPNSASSNCAACARTASSSISRNVNGV